MALSSIAEAASPVAVASRALCHACGGPEGRVLLRADDVRAEQSWLERFHALRLRDQPEDAKDRASFTQSEERTVVACTACGTVLRVPRPSPEQIEETYAEDEYGHETLEKLAANQDDFFAAKLPQLDRELAALGSGARVLEIGSFVGGFLCAARERGWRALGIDVGEETSRFVRERGFEVLRGDVLDLDLEPGFAAVFVWSTFDQLGEPEAVLDRIASLLAPNGLLVLRVPNGRFETVCLELRRRARGIARARHVLCAQAYNNFVSFPYLTGYTPESLSGMLAEHGFRVERVAGDTILRLADDRTLPYAVREEQRCKRAVHRACRAGERATGLLSDPWLDVVAQLA